MDLDAPDVDEAPLDASASQEPLPGVSSVTRPRSRRGGPGTAPSGSKPPHHSAAVSSQVLTLFICSLLLVGNPLNYIPHDGDSKPDGDVSS